MGGIKGGGREKGEEMGGGRGEQTQPRPGVELGTLALVRGSFKRTMTYSRK